MNGRKQMLEKGIYDSKVKCVIVIGVESKYQLVKINMKNIHIIFAQLNVDEIGMQMSILRMKIGENNLVFVQLKY